MVVEVQVGVVDPDGPAEVSGHEPDLLAEARNQVQARADVLAELDVGGSGAVEQGRRGDVHVRPVVLEVQERGIEACQAVGHCKLSFA